MKFRNLKPNGFAATRERLGLSQQQLAEHLGISRTTITMAETGRRKLPTPALLKLAELEIKMAAVIGPALPAKVDETNMDLPIEATPEFIQIRELQCDLKIQKLTTRLELMSANYKKFNEQLQLLDALLLKEPDDPGNMFMLSMRIHRDGVLKQMAKCSLTEQALLRNKIALLSAESHLNMSVRQKFS